MRVFDSEASAIDRDDVLAVLEAGPQSTQELAVWLGASRPIVHAALVAMAIDGVVVRVRSSRAWAVPSMVPPDARERMVHRAARKPLRQPTAPTTVPADAAPSWWVGLDRATFDAAAARELSRMQGSKMANKVMVTEG